MILVPHAKDMPGNRVGLSTAWEVPSDGKRGHLVETSTVMLRTWDNINNLYGMMPDGEPIPWYAACCMGDGSVCLIGASPTVLPPPGEVCVRMVEVVRQLNRELHAQGFWTVVWHPQQRLSMLWSDGDGTPKFSVDVDEPWARVRGWSNAELVSRAFLGMDGFAQTREEVGMPIDHDTLRPAPQAPGWIADRTLH